MSEAFFFSVQTGMTIGYGSMAPNADCYWTIIGVTSQSIIALAIDAILLGLTFDRVCFICFICFYLFIFVLFVFIYLFLFFLLFFLFFICFNIYFDYLIAIKN